MGGEWTRPQRRFRPRWSSGWTNQFNTPTHVRFFFLSLQSKMYLLCWKTLQCVDPVWCQFWWPPLSLVFNVFLALHVYWRWTGIKMRVSLILHPCAQKRESVMWPDFPVFSRQVDKKFVLLEFSQLVFK